MSFEFDPTVPINPTTIKQALMKWMETTGTENLTLAEDVSIQFQFPPIAKMDKVLSVLKSCRKLDLSTNTIERLAGLWGLKKLKILILNRNYILDLCGIEVLANTLEELYINNNLVEKLKVMRFMKRLKIFEMNKNLVKSWDEIRYLEPLKNLKILKLAGNPLAEIYEVEDEEKAPILKETYIEEALKLLPTLNTLDDIDLLERSKK